MASPPGPALPPSPMSVNRATVVLDCLLKGAWTPWTPFAPSSGRARHAALNDNHSWRFRAPPTGDNAGYNYWCLCTGPRGNSTVVRHRNWKPRGWQDVRRWLTRQEPWKQASANPFDGGGKHSAAAKHGRLVADGHFSQLLVWRLAGVQRRNPETSEDRAGWIKRCGI